MRRALLCLSLLAGCGTTPPARFYVLDAVTEASTTSSTSSSGDGLSVDVGPILLSGGLDRAQMVTRLGPHEVALHEYARWADPLEDNITRVLAEDLAVQLGSENVGVVPDAMTQQPSWRVTVQIVRFEVGADDASLLVARWRLFKPGEGRPTTTRKTVYSTPMPTPDAAGMAAALSADLANLARDIAAALKPG
jgi:uncharacterized lipoprotein YmbA